MANGTIHKLGTLYVNNIKYPFPTKPWRSDQAPTGTPSVGNILNYDSVNGNIEIRNTDSDDANQLRWVEVNDGDKKLLISDRCLLVKVAWDELNAQGLISGKEITIDGLRYKIRVLSGGTSIRSGTDNYSGGTPTTNEWDRIITNESSFSGLPIPTSTDLDTSQNATDFNGAHNQFWNWYPVYSWCQETNFGDATYRSCRGYNSARWYGTSGASNRFVGVGWRPVLEVLNTAPSISIQNQDLGNNQSPIIKNYSVTDIDGDTLTVVEKLDGTTIRTLSNQTSGTSYTLDLSSQWEGLSLGKHTVEIIATDSNVMFSKTNTVTITFAKTKTPITKPPTDASLVDLVNFTQEQNNELSYQCYKLKNNLTAKGVTVLPTDKMSILIDKVNELEDKIVPLYLYKNGDECTNVTGGWTTKWTRSAWSSIPIFSKDTSKMYYNGTTTTTTNASISHITKIDLTNYSTLKMEFNLKTLTTSSQARAFELSVFNSLTDNSPVASADNTSTVGLGTTVCVLDISNLNGLYYVCPYICQWTASKTMDVEIYKIWLEK